MMQSISGADIRRQLKGSYGMGMICALLGAIVLGVMAVLFAGSLGATHTATIITGLLAAVCLLLTVWLIIKMATVGNHHTFKKYGSPEFIAEYINTGAKDALFLSGSVKDNLPFGLMITEKFIVAALEYADYLELKDIRTVQPTFLPETQTVYIGRTPASMLGAMAVNYANERYRQAHPVDPNARYDYLVMRDADNVRHQYAVQRQDMETVMNILIQYAPQMKILEPKPL